MGIISYVKSFGEKTLYFPGKFTSENLVEESRNYQEILGKLGVSFILMDLYLDSGIGFYQNGYKKEAKRNAEKIYGLFKENLVTRVIVSSPEDYYMFKEVYPILVRGWDIKVEYILLLILDQLRTRGTRYLGREEDREIVSYQDSCISARYLGITDEPREIIEILGGRLKEIRNSKEDVLCCGAGGGMLDNNPKLAEECGQRRAMGIPEDSSKFICGSGLCHFNLRKHSEKSIEISSFILSKLRGLGV